MGLDVTALSSYIHIHNLAAKSKQGLDRVKTSTSYNFVKRSRVFVVPDIHVRTALE